VRGGRAAVTATFLLAGFLSLPSAASAAVGRVAESLTVQTSFLNSWTEEPCAQPAPSGDRLICLQQTGSGAVPGLGTVSLSFTVVQDFGSTCVRLAVADATLTSAKGMLEFSGAKPDCAGTLTDALVKGDVPATVTGGDGGFAGASGQGTVTLVSYTTSSGFSGRATGQLTLTVDAPAGNFDLTPPSISGAVSKTVVAPRTTKRAHVRYAVTAQDASDGPVPVSCKPRSGSAFALGRTKVTCTATDASDNTASQTFTITVRRAKS
jgi:HYR domain